MKSIVLLSITTVHDAVNGLRGVGIATDWLVQFESANERSEVAHKSNGWAVVQSMPGAMPDNVYPLFRDYRVAVPAVTEDLEKLLSKTLVVTAKLPVHMIINWLAINFKERFIYRINAEYDVTHSNIPYEDQQYFKQFGVPSPGRIAVFRTPECKIKHLG